MNQIAASRARFERIVELLKTGADEKAEALCREAVEQDPSDANFLALMGAILLQKGQAKDAEDLLRRALDIAPGFAKAHDDMGAALLAQGRTEEGITHLRRAVKLDPKLEPAWVNLGRALAEAGRDQEADAAIEQAFALSPDKRVLAEAVEHFLNKRYRDAEKLARGVLQRKPSDINAMRLLAKIAMEAEAWEDAERLLRRVVELAPEFLEARHELARALKEQDKALETVDCLQQALRLAPNDGQTHYLLAAAMAQAGRTANAVEAYQRSLELRPNHPGALLGLGHVMKTVGRQEEGIKAYRNAIKQRPMFGEAYWSLANLKTFRFTDEELAAMEAAVESGKLDDDAEVHFCFSLGKAYDDRKDYDKAFSYYERGNTRQRMRVAYDPVQSEVTHNRIIEVFTRDFLEEKSGSGFPDPAPIFIVGLPRSGSTLIEQILASHSQVEGTSELPDLGRIATSINKRGGGLTYPDAVHRLEPEDFFDLGKSYIDSTMRHRRLGRPYFIDKMPNNFPTIGFLRLVLPNAKIINARRHPLDSCLGCYKQHFAKGQSFTYDLTELGEFYLEYQRLMEHWHDVLPGRILDVTYEEMVADQENQTRRLLDYCGLPWEEQCLRFYETDRPVRTASSEQVRQPIYRESVHAWKNYEKHLRPLIQILQPVLQR